MKYCFKNYTISIVIVFFIGCRSDNKLNDIFFEKTTELKHQVIIDKEEGLMGYDLTVLNDSLMVLFNPGKDKIYELVNLNSGKSIFRFAKLGEGPGEFSMPTQLSLGIKKNGIIGVFHRRSFIFSEIPLDSIIRDPDYTPAKTYSGFDFNHYALYKLNNGNFLGLGYFDKRFVISNSEGQLLYKFGEYPFEEELQIAGFTKAKLAYTFQGTGKFHPSGDKFIFASRSALNFDILDIQKDTAKVSYQLHLEKPMILPGDPESFDVEFDIGNKVAFVDVSVTEKHIYLLYFGKSRKDIVDFDLDGAREIWVFDWEGQPLHKIHLDIGLSNIEVINDHKIIGINNKKIPEVYEFDLIGLK